MMQIIISNQTIKTITMAGTSQETVNITREQLERSEYFTIPATLRMALLVGMGIGLLCLGLTWITDDAIHSRFWSNFLHNSVFFTGISIVALFALCAFITAYAGWFSVFKRLWEAYSMYLIVGLVCMAILTAGVIGHFNHLYHWADAEAVQADEILQHKSAFLNSTWYAVASIGFLGLFYFIARRIRSFSLDEDNSGILDHSHHRKIKVWAAVLLPLVGFLGPACIWLWVMSVDAHWYSTLFAWYCFASFFVSMIAITILLLMYLQSKGYYPNVTSEHYHDLGKYMFAFSIFWTYLWFSQYMLIWYANVGEETVYFYERLTNYRPLFFANLVVNFLLPFFVLMRNDTKRKAGTLSLVAIILVIFHWIDFFLMIKPGVLHTTHEVLAHMGTHGADHTMHHGHGGFTPGFTAPGFLEFGTFIGFLSLFLFVTLSALSSARTMPRRDPYIGESLHHHT